MGDLTEKGVRRRLPEKQDGEKTHLTATIFQVQRRQTGVNLDAGLSA